MLVFWWFLVLLICCVFPCAEGMRRTRISSPSSHFALYLNIFTHQPAFHPVSTSRDNYIWGLFVRKLGAWLCQSYPPLGRERKRRDLWVKYFLEKSEGQYKAGPLGSVLYRCSPSRFFFPWKGKFTSVPSPVELGSRAAWLKVANSNSVASFVTVCVDSYWQFLRMENHVANCNWVEAFPPSYSLLIRPEAYLSCPR